MKATRESGAAKAKKRPARCQKGVLASPVPGFGCDGEAEYSAQDQTGASATRNKAREILISRTKKEPRSEFKPDIGQRRL